MSREWCTDSASPEEYGFDFKCAVFKRIETISFMSTLRVTAIMWIVQGYTDSILVQVMDWCRQAVSHYLNQSWPRHVVSYGFIRPEGLGALHYIECALYYITDFKCAGFKCIKTITFMSILRVPHCLYVNRAGLYWFNIGTGNGLVPPGSKSLLEPKLTQTCCFIWLH